MRVEQAALPALVDEVRGRIAPGKRIVWRSGPSTRPVDLVDRLLMLGLTEPDDRARVLNAVVCLEPPAAPADIDVRRVETYDDYAASMHVMWDAFETPPERQAAQQPHMRTMFEAARQAGVPVTFLAYLDGRPTGVGRSVYSEHGVFLISGAVVPWGRSRGVYRALVRARWDDAVARGTPALVTHAVPDTSYPILKRLGFVDVCSLRRLEDPRQSASSGAVTSTVGDS